MTQNSKNYKRIYLENDAPGIFPSKTRKANWGDESVKESPPTDAPDLDTSGKGFLEKFIKPPIPGNVNLNDLKGIFLRFHLHKDLILQLLAQGGDCFGLAINLGTKDYLYEGEDKTVTGIGITITAIGKDMEDIGITPNRNVVLFSKEPSPCPPTDPCPSQRAVVSFFNVSSPNTSLVSQ
ncbi:MAG: hypothetical protein EAZ32_19230 [Cytophagia bacterium]|nr:MAG: hypothetical protein EAZ46_11325 [Runella sp.]TAG16750.1 MAG: hypothetical protein EAZ38_18440 [Cytophagales bacterium]TAG34752.1 MAG: hypothetical protein EAZ32_19230 [Cytophagia bacterium]TAG76625.1 MAG: hypothetical protein EAZ22_17580 [Cytophagales bacterium]